MKRVGLVRNSLQEAIHPLPRQGGFMDSVLNKVP